METDCRATKPEVSRVHYEEVVVRFQTPYFTVSPLASHKVGCFITVKQRNITGNFTGRNNTLIIQSKLFSHLLKTYKLKPVTKTNEGCRVKLCPETYTDHSSTPYRSTASPKRFLFSFHHVGPLEKIKIMLKNYSGRYLY